MWDKAVETQMHFNEMSHKSRQLGLSVVIAALGLPGAIFIGKVSVPLVTPFELSGLIVSVASLLTIFVGHFDVVTYQTLLLGAVKFGWELEKSSLTNELLNTRHGMTTYISIAAGDLNADGTLKTPDKDGFGFRVGIRRIEKFYRCFTYILLLLAIVLIGIEDGLFWAALFS